MFEKEAEENLVEQLGFDKGFIEQEVNKLKNPNNKFMVDALIREVKYAYQKGAEFGYNKANEWQFVSEKGLPKESGRYLVYVGGGENGVYPLDFETEYNDFGYWCLIVNSASLGVTDTIFETITERKEDKVIAWKEIVLPKEIKEK